jgi:hypothetical protein
MIGTHRFEGQRHMTDFSGFDLERTVDRGWHQFETWLRAALDTMKDGDVIVVSRESGSRERVRAHQPQLRFTAHGDGLMRGEASSNRQLDRHFWLSEQQVERLVEIGYDLPSSPADALATSASTQFSVDGDRSYRPALAALSIRALREVFDVLHPAFLAITGDIHRAFDADAIEAPSPPPSAFPQTPEGIPVSGTLARDWGLAQAGPIAMPESPSHLRQLIEQALVPVLGRRPVVDEDGDFVVPWDGSLVFVRVIEAAPVIAVFSQLVRGIEDTALAVHEVAGLNTAVEMVKFFLVDDRIVAGCTLPANPFVGEHLRELLALVGGVARDFRQPLTLLAGEGPAFPA